MAAVESGFEEEPDAEYEDDYPAAAGTQGLPDDDEKVRRKLHLFQNGSIQRSIKRIWELLPKEEKGNLPMAGYIGLNISLQKCLTQDFDLPRAVDSAVGDWAEDVREGQNTMNVDDFCMFLFELCSLWCGPSVSLRAYLLFLNAVFIAITDARGAHTVGLKEVEAVERLPDAFFELLSVQGWARLPEEEQRLDPEQAMNAWLAWNLSPENEQTSLLQVQRQIFQVTHDVRAVLLFKEKDGKRDHQDLLDLVKQASRNLSKVNQVDPHSLLDSSAGHLTRTDHPSARRNMQAELCAQPWWPPNHKRHPGAGQSGPPGPLVGSGAGAAAAAAATCKPRGRSAPGRRRRELANSSPHGLPAVLDRLPGVSRLHHDGGQLALPPAVPRRPPAVANVPVGRAFDVVQARRPKALVVAGHSSLAAAEKVMPQTRAIIGTAESALSGWSKVNSTTSGEATRNASSLERGTPLDVGVVRQGSSVQASSVVSPDVGPRFSPASDESQQIVTATASPVFDDIAIGSAMAAEADEQAVELSRQPQLLAEVAQHLVDGSKSAGAEGTFLEGVALSPAYHLPHKPAHLYKMQTEPALNVKPSSVVFASRKFQTEHPLLGEPFERSLKKIPAQIRPQSEGPNYGPLAHPNEPVWFEMAHRLQVILKKQGRRAERRRKRRLRSKLFRGRSRKAETRKEGQELREYLDAKAAEAADGFRVAPGEPNGEFLKKVHERYLLNRELVEAQPFRYRGTGGAVVDAHGIGYTPTRPQAVVRPVYVPPPET